MIFLQLNFSTFCQQCVWRYLWGCSMWSTTSIRRACRCIEPSRHRTNYRFVVRSSLWSGISSVIRHSSIWWMLLDYYYSFYSCTNLSKSPLETDRWSWESALSLNDPSKRGSTEPARGLERLRLEPRLEPSICEANEGTDLRRWRLPIELCSDMARLACNESKKS